MNNIYSKHYDEPMSRMGAMITFVLILIALFSFVLSIA